MFNLYIQLVKLKENDEWMHNLAILLREGLKKIFAHDYSKISPPIFGFQRRNGVDYNVSGKYINS